MSPLVAAPNRGYADYQRVGNFDTGVLFSGSVVNNTTILFSGTLDVSRFDRILMHLSMALGMAEITFQWYADAGATVPIGARNMFTDTANSGSIQMSVPNLGPFVTIQVQSLTVANYSVTLACIASNRDVALEMTPGGSPTIMRAPASNLPASGSVTINPTDYYAGPVRVLFVTTVSAQIQIEALNFLALYDNIDIFVAGAGTFNPFNTVLPFGAWRVEVFNKTAGAGTVTVLVTPSDTGAT